MGNNESPKTLYDKIFEAHVVTQGENEPALLYIDRHLLHEVTSPQAFEGLRQFNRSLRRLDKTLATIDHSVGTNSRKDYKSLDTYVTESQARIQCVALEKNVKEFGVAYFGLDDERQGIVHIVGPEQGFTLPGTTVVCGDSHTSTHGAFGALAFGIGTSEIEHVLATQTLPQNKAKNFLVQIDGSLNEGCSSKDVILHVIGVIGTAGGTGHVIEYAGSLIEKLSMEARMSISNMSIEAGARAGIIAPDETTFAYLKGRPLAPKPDSEEWENAIAYWKTLKSDPNAHYDRKIFIDAKDIVPTVTWGTSPEDVVPITGTVPDPSSCDSKAKKESMKRSLEYMNLKPNEKITDVTFDKVFIGSCTNGRIEDLRSVAKVVKGRKIASNVKHAMIVPGSTTIKKLAESEGLDKIFTEAGFDWREAGCSMCLGMNNDILSPGERCISTSNRNFEGRQGAGGLTHLASPATAAASAIVGRIADVRDLLKDSAHSDESTNPEYVDVCDQKYKEMNRSHKVPLIRPSQTTKSTQDTKSNESSANTKKFVDFSGIAAPFDMANINTDLIIPKQFLTTIKRSGLGEGLFNDLRYIDRNKKNGLNPDFILNQEPFNKSQIIVCSGENFGCGSSREHAIWAFSDFGIKAIIAPSFSDIHFQNLLKNGLLAVKLDADIIENKLHPVAKQGRPLTIHLEDQQILDDENNVLASFVIDPFQKACLQNGLDDIQLTLKKSDLINKYEQITETKFPWLNCPFDKQVEAVIQPLKKQKLEW